MEITKQLIIIEGPDFTGKTTLAKELARTMHRPYWHCTASRALQPGLADYHMNVVRNLMHNSLSGQTMVMDRFWPSEVCYAPVFDRSLAKYGEELMKIVHYVQMLNPLYVFCRAQDPVKRFIKHTSEHVDPMHNDMDEIDYMNISANYYGLAGRMMEAGCSVVFYDYDLHGKYPAQGEWCEEANRKHNNNSQKGEIDYEWIDDIINGRE